MLSERQQLSVQHLNHKRQHTPEEIIEWATEQIKKPCRNSVRYSLNKNRPKRNHSKSFYEQIIAHYREELGNG